MTSNRVANAPPPYRTMDRVKMEMTSKLWVSNWSTTSTLKHIKQPELGMFTVFDASHVPSINPSMCRTLEALIPCM